MGIVGPQAKLPFLWSSAVVKKEKKRKENRKWPAETGAARCPFWANIGAPLFKDKNGPRIW